MPKISNVHSFHSREIDIALSKIQIARKNCMSQNSEPFSINGLIIIKISFHKLFLEILPYVNKLVQCSNIRLPTVRRYVPKILTFERYSSA